MMRMGLLLLCLLLTRTGYSLEIVLPTANDSLLRTGHDAEFFQPTIEGTTESGMFGCVRRDGARFHEGIDIRCRQRDKNGEPIDLVVAVSDGTVAFINTKSGLSNYGRYIILEHRWDGVQVFTLYAHLRATEDDLAVGQSVKNGQRIATMGRSTNTHEGISKDRAHLHFEIDFMVNPGFRIWYPKREPKAPPFGNFNGKNLIGLDPAALLRAAAGNAKLNFRDYVAKQTVAFTVLVGPRPFAWLSMHPEQIAARTANAVAYEIGATSTGLPIAVWPRRADDINQTQRRILQRGLPVLHRVSIPELSRANCTGLVRQTAHGWELTERGGEWVDLLTYAP